MTPHPLPCSVLVVGASRGIGLELVRQYRAEGVRVSGARVVFLSSVMASIGGRQQSTGWRWVDRRDSSRSKTARPRCAAPSPGSDRPTTAVS